MRNFLKLLVASVTFSRLLISSVNAEVLITNSFGDGATQMDNITAVGSSFVLDQAITVTDLGAWDKDQDGFTTNVKVQLWSASSVELANVTITGTAGSTMLGTYRYKSLPTALVLPAGTYYLGVSYHGEERLEDGPVTVGLGISSIYQSWNVLKDIAPINVGGSNSSYIGPNMIYNSVSEPSMITLLDSSFDFTNDNDEITLTWISSPTQYYRITSSPDLVDWTTIIARGIEGDLVNLQTSITAPITRDVKAFFRVEEE